MTLALLTLGMGLVCAGLGGELFVRGTVGIAQATRISPGVIAATVAAFATSSPELTAAAVLGEPKPGRAAVESLGGLALLIAAGRLIVSGATDIALAFGLSQFAIGATVVAIGTSVPELATTVISRIRGHDEVGLGTILGSNIFNTLFIVGVASTITPIEVPVASVAVPLIAGTAAIALTFPPRSGLLARWRGGILVALFVAYLAAAIQTPSH